MLCTATAGPIPRSRDIRQAENDYHKASSPDLSRCSQASQEGTPMRESGLQGLLDPWSHWVWAVISQFQSSRLEGM